VILGALSIGYYLGGRAADRSPSFYVLSLIILSAGFFIGLVPVISNVILDPAITDSLGMKYGPLVSVLILFTIPGVLLGMVSPYAVKLEARSIERIGNVTGNLYAISTLGSIAGTFATAFFLIPEIGVKAILFSLSAVLVLTAFACAGRKIIPTATLGLVFFLGIALPASTYDSSQGYLYSVVYQKDTEYYQIKIVDYANSATRAMFLDNSFTAAQYKNSSEAVYAYTDFFHLPFIINPGTRDVLFLGGGAGTGPKRFHEEYEDVSMDVVEIDPAVNDAAVRYFGLRVDERIRLYAEEGRSFLSNSAKRYDLIVIDVFNSRHSVPYHLMTEEFVRELKEHLNANGSVILNVHGSISGPASRLFHAEYATYRRVFPNVYVFPVGGDPNVVQNIMILASKSERRYSRKDFIIGAGPLSDKTGIKFLEAYAAQYLEEKVDEDIPVLTDDYAPVDNMLLDLEK
jgi:spermidine synthase